MGFLTLQVYDYFISGKSIPNRTHVTIWTREKTCINFDWALFPNQDHLFEGTPWRKKHWNFKTLTLATSFSGVWRCSPKRFLLTLRPREQRRRDVVRTVLGWGYRLVVLRPHLTRSRSRRSRRFFFCGNFRWWWFRWCWSFSLFLLQLISSSLRVEKPCFTDSNTIPSLIFHFSFWN